MMIFPSGRKYKLIYLDTNCINEISKNTKKIGKNFLENYCNGEYMFLTSSYNIFELSKTKGETRNEIIKIFNNFPLAVIETFPQLIEFEKNESEFNPKMIMFAMGIKPIFNVQLETILIKCEKDVEFQDSIKKMLLKFDSIITMWQKQQKVLNRDLEFKKNLLFSMNEIFRFEENYFEITQLGKYKSLEVMAFIKNQFIYESKKEIRINSIIDTYNCSILPYIDIYITEKTVSSWLEKAKNKFEYISDKQIIKISDLME